MSRPFDDVMGSAVIPTAKAIVDPDWLLDELELRLTRCVLPAAGPVTSPRIGSVLPAGEALHRIASWETRSWWNEQGLSDLDEQVQRSILEAMLLRSPLYLGWAAVPLLSVLPEELVDAEALMHVVDWVTAFGPVQRVVRDAIALSLLLPWLERWDVPQAAAMITTLCRCQEPMKIRMGFMVAAAYARGSEHVDRKLSRTMLDLCWTHARRVDPETAMALGWVLKELLRQEPTRILPEVLTRVQELSRQAMRTAVEGLPMGIRRRLTAKWLERVRSSAPSAISPESVARPKRLR